MIEQLIYTNQFDQFVGSVSINDINNLNLECGKTLLEISAEENQLKFFEFMVTKVFDIAEHRLTKASRETKQVLDKRVSFLETEFKAGYSRLHVAVIDGEVQMIQYILKGNLIDVNNSNVPIGTPLHLAILLGRIDCVEALMDYDIDVDLVNKHNQTALQMAIEHKITAKVPELFLRSKNIDESRYMGLTTMHMAIVNNCQCLIPHLIEVGANPCLEIQTFDANSMKELVGKYSKVVPILPLSSIENSFTLHLKLYGTINTMMLNCLSKENINKVDGNGNTLLHLTASLQDAGLCEVLIMKGADVNFFNYLGKNPLHEMLRLRPLFKQQTKIPVAVGTVLINAGVHINSTDWDDICKDILLLNSEKFLILVLQNITQFDSRTWDFNAIVKRRWFQASNVLLSLLPSSLIAENVNRNHVEFYLQHAKPQETQYLLSICPEEFLNKYFSVILDQLVTKNDVASFKLMSNLKVTNPGLLDSGETLLTNLMKIQKFNFVQILLESISRELYINMRNKSGESPLYLALITKNLSLIDVFVIEYVDFNLPDTNGDTILCILFKTFINDTDISFLEKTAKIMINGGASPFFTDSNNIPAIDHCVDSNVKSRIISYAEKKNIGANSSKSETECKICLTRPVEYVLDCGHLFCVVCADKCKRCPICRMPSKSSRKIFF